MSIYLNEREEERAALTGKIKYSREPDGICYDARVKNCTKGGMAFITKAPYLKETRLFLHSKNKDDMSIQTAEVAWSSPDIHDGRYTVGVKFIGH